MLEFSEKLTLTPNLMTEQDLAGLRAHGFTDRDILSIILAAAYRNYIVRVADALGVELNPTVEYAPELIRAFGVDDRQARTTLYADRLARNDAGTKTVVTQRSQSPAQSSTDRVCWIDMTPPPASTEEFQKARDELVKLSAPTPLRNLSQTFALRPDALAVTVEYLRRVSLGGSGLGQRLESIIGLVVAATLSSQYMGIHHAQRLLHDGATLDDVGLLVGSSSEGATEPRECILVRFCERLTRVPGTTALSDVEALRAVGFTDRDIITIAASVSLENFLCRVADGVGLQLEREPDMRAASQAFQASTGTLSA
jgi:alkylhydroperoxidase family enzyme